VSKAQVTMGRLWRDWIDGKRAAGLLCAAALAAAIGCEKTAAPHARSLRFRGNNSDVYLNSVAATLNDLPDALDLELLPAQPILTASSSKDGKEVRAICGRNPQSPDGPFNFLQAVDGNANFATIQVQPGDIVRYYVNVDADAAERNIEQRTALELRVRRLDAQDPENALIIEGGLSGPALVPQRIEIWRYSDKRMDAIRSMMKVYEVFRRPPAGWEPSPDLAALRQIVERGNQWLRNQLVDDGEDSWRIEPLLAGLPEELRSAKGVAELITPDAQRNGVFADWEGRLLEQAVWSRDIAQWARGDALADLDAVTSLFDWTVRNVQLDLPGDGPTMISHPWQALVYGHGTAEHRAWVFAELCRQQGIDVVILKPTAGADGQPAPLLAGALVDGQVYLFDPQLGLPIGGRAAAVATLAEAAENDDLLRAFDISGELTYPLTAAQLDRVDALIVASPLQLARRSALLEAALEGEEFVKLTANANALGEQLAEQPHIAAVRLWERPFQAVADEFGLKPSVRQQAAAEFEPFAQRPLLWKARVLHFQGNKDVRAEERSDPLAQPRSGHQDAPKLYQDRTVRPSDDVLATLDATKREVYEAAKAASSYWLGLLIYDRGDYEIASSWLGDRTLEREPKGKWAPGARYNLARAYDKLGRTDEAVKLLEATPESDPQRIGNLVLAKQLVAKAEATVEAERGGEVE
jgi:pyridoxine/pyridoxamine 5'-phosphate oxidase